MKNKLWLIFKNSIVNSFKLKSMTKKKKLLIGLLVIYIGGSFGVSISVFMNSIYKSLAEKNLSSYFITLLFTLSSMASFVFTIFTAKGWLFENKDNNLLLSLPIKRNTILLSRLLYICLINLLIGLVVMIPGLVIYISNTSINFIFCLSLLLMVVFSPAIPTVIACLMGYLIAFITSKAKYKNVVEFVFYIIFIILYFTLYFLSNKILNSLMSNPQLLSTILKVISLPTYLINKGIANNNFIYILYFLLLNGGMIFIFITLLYRSYFKILSGLSSHYTKSNFKMHDVKVKSVKKALTMKEVKRYFSSAIYVFNTILGPIFIVGGIIACILYSPSKLIGMFGFGEDVNSFSIVFYYILYTIAFTNTTCSAISIERDSFWILKMLPVETKDIFSAKLFVNRIIVSPIALLAILAFMITGYINVFEMLALMVMSVAFNFFISNFGLICNLIFPKLDAINDTVVVKQSTSSFVSVMGGFVIGIILILVSTAFTSNGLCTAVIGAVISVLFYIISTIVLNTWGIKRFNQLN